MDPKILNTDDNDKLNPEVDVVNYAAGNETGNETADEEENTRTPVDTEVLKEDKPLPGELAFPQEQEEADEMP